MSLFSKITKNLVSKVSANTVDKFKTLVNSYTEYGTGDISNGQVLLTIPDGSAGISIATDLKKRMADIEWSRGYSWDVYISPAPPAPFNNSSYGLPVIEVQSDFALIGNSTDLPAANSVYRAPLSKNFFDIKLTMLDDEKGTMEQYFEHWMDWVYSWDNGALRGTINYLDKSVRQLTITKITSTKKTLYKRTYLVYPESNFSSFDNSTGGVRNFSINLVVAGYMGREAPQSVPSHTGSNVPSSEYGSILDAVKASTTPTSVGDARWNYYATDSGMSVINPSNMRSDSVLTQTLKGTSGTLYGGGAASNLPNSIF